MGDKGGNEQEWSRREVGELRWPLPGVLRPGMGAGQAGVARTMGLMKGSTLSTPITLHRMFSAQHSRCGPGHMWHTGTSEAGARWADVAGTSKKHAALPYATAKLRPLIGAGPPATASSPASYLSADHRARQLLPACSPSTLQEYAQHPKPPLRPCLENSLGRATHLHCPHPWAAGSAARSAPGCPP